MTGLTQEKLVYTPKELEPLPVVRKVSVRLDIKGQQFVDQFPAILICGLQG